VEKGETSSLQTGSAAKSIFSSAYKSGAMESRTNAIPLQAES